MDDSGEIAIEGDDTDINGNGNEIQDLDNRDYIDHLNNEENARDGDPNQESIIAPFKVVRTIKRRGRAKGAAAAFGFFASRGGVSGSQLTQSTLSPSQWPKKGPGSRGGKGKAEYKI